MEGVSKEFNEIYLEVTPENIVKALKTANNAKWIKIKLTKKHIPCLTFEVDLVCKISDFFRGNMEMFCLSRTSYLKKVTCPYKILLVLFHFKHSILANMLSGS